MFNQRAGDLDAHQRFRKVSLELIEIIQQGGPGRENETVYRINPDVARV